MIDRSFQLGMNGDDVKRILNMVSEGSISILTEEPVQDNLENILKVVLLEQEPSQRYNGYWYIITWGQYNLEQQEEQEE